MLKKLLIFAGSLLLTAISMAAVGGPAGNFIRSQNTLQPGATFYVSSGTVVNVNVTTITFSDGTMQATSADASNFIQNRNTLQSGSTAYPQFLAVGTSGAIGISSTTVKFHVSDGVAVSTSLITSDPIVLSYQTGAPGFSIIAANNNPTGRAVFKGVKSSGTLSSPGIPTEGHDVLTFLGAIYDGTNTEATAGVNFRVDGPVSNDVAPQRIGFATSDTTGASRTERLIIKSSGTIGIGTTNPAKALEINSTNSNNLRLTYNDSDGSAANYSDFSVLPNGSLVISPTGETIINSKLTSISTFSVAGSTIILNGTTYYWNAGIGSNGQFLKTDGAAIPTLTWGTSAGGGGSSSLGVFKNGVQVSSPTAQINFLGSYWGVNLGGASTATITLIGGSTHYIQNSNTLISGSTFYVSSGSVQGDFNIVTGTAYFNSGMSLSGRRLVLDANPVDSDVLTWDSSSSRWMPKSLAFNGNSLEIPWKDDVTGTLGWDSRFKFDYNTGVLYSDYLSLVSSATIGNGLRVSNGVATFVSSMTLSGNRLVQDVAPSNGQVLKWNSGNNRWQPDTDNSGGGGGGTTIWVQEGGSAVDNAVSTMNFTSTDFDLVSNPAGKVTVSLNPNSTFYIQNTNTLQSGATAYLSQIYVSSLTVGTPNMSSQTPLTLYGGSGGYYLMKLNRSVGSTINWGISLSNNGVIFSDLITSRENPGFYSDLTTNDIYLGIRSAQSANTRDSLLSATSFATASGADVPGNDLFLRSGLGTGQGVSGDIFLQTASTSTTNTLQTASNRMVVRGVTGRIGVNTSTPTTQFEINASSGNNLRLTYNDSDGSAANYSDFSMTSGGDLSITASGGEIRSNSALVSLSTSIVSNGSYTPGNLANATVVSYPYKNYSLFKSSSPYANIDTGDLGSYFYPGIINVISNSEYDDTLRPIATFMSEYIDDSELVHLYSVLVVNNNSIDAYSKINSNSRLNNNSGSGTAFYDSNSSNYSLFKSSEAIDYDIEYVLPNSTGSINQVLAIQAERVDGKRTLYWKTDETGGGSGGASVYPATATASFPYGFSASTGVFTSSLTIPSGTSPVLSAAGHIAEDTTDNQLIYGASSKVIPFHRQYNIPVSNPSAGTYLIGKSIDGMTIRSINCLVDPSDSGENTVIQIQECDSNGDSCADVDSGTDITCGNTNTADDGSLSNPSIDANDWYALEIVSVSGAVSRLNITIDYETVRE